MGADDVEGGDFIFASTQINRADALRGIHIPRIAAIGDHLEGVRQIIVGKGVEIGDGKKLGLVRFAAEWIEEHGEPGGGGDENDDRADGDGQHFFEERAAVVRGERDVGAVGLGHGAGILWVR